MTVMHMPHPQKSDHCRACPVRPLGFCSWFGEGDSNGMAARARQSRFASGVAILEQGEPAERVGIIMSGLVKIVVIDEDGEEHLIQLLHAGEMVGDPFMIESVCTWQAATDCEICWVAPGTLASAIRACPTAYRCQLDATMRLVAEQRFAQIALRGRSALQRVAHWLYLQIPHESTAAPIRFRIVLTRRDLASLLEMTVETLCRALHQLEERGAIRLAAPDLVDLSDRALLKRLGRGHDDRLQQSLLGEGWEWGARPVAAKPVTPLIPRKTDAEEPAGPKHLTSINDGRRAS